MITKAQNKCNTDASFINKYPKANVAKNIETNPPRNKIPKTVVIVFLTIFFGSKGRDWRKGTRVLFAGITEAAKSTI